MRTAFTGLALLIGASAQPAAAQEYPWCAYYDMEGMVSNCGFVSLEQCRWTISGIGGYCAQNPFYAAVVEPRRTQPTLPKRPQRSGQ